MSAAPPAPSPEPLHRRDLSAQVAASLDYSEDEVDLVVVGLLDAIANALADGHRVSFRGFGRFDARVMAPTERTVPGTTDKVMQGEHVRVLFKPSDQLRERVHEGRRNDGRE